MLFKELQERKNKGEKIRLKDLTRDHLYQLYVVEGVLNSSIAELCDCSSESVSSKRHRLRVLFEDRVLLQLSQHLKESWQNH